MRSDEAAYEAVETEPAAADSLPVGPLGARAVWRSVRGSFRSATAGSIAAGLAIQGMLVATGPLLARMLGPDGRGELAAFAIWPSVLTAIGVLGVPAAVTYYVSRNRSSAGAVARTALSLAGPQVAVTLILLAALAPVVFPASFDDFWAAAALALLGIPALVSQQYGLALLQGCQRFREFNLLRVLPLALYAAGVVTLFLAGVRSVLPALLTWSMAWTVAGAVSLVTGLRVARRAEGAGSPARRSLVSFGLRGLLVRSPPVAVFRLDQLVLALFLPPASLGIYVVGLAFTNLPDFIAKSIGLVAFPRVAAASDDSSARRSLWRFFFLNVLLSTAAVVPLFAAAGWLVPLFFGSDFGESVEITRILLPGVIFLSARRVLAEGLMGRGSPGAGSTAELISLAALGVGLAVLVPGIGTPGAAVALAASHLLGLLALLVLAGLRGELRGAG